MGNFDSEKAFFWGGGGMPLTLWYVLGPNNNIDVLTSIY